MEIPTYHIVRLKFILKSDSPNEIKRKWFELKTKFEIPEENELIVKGWLNQCNNDYNRNFFYIISNDNLNVEDYFSKNQFIKFRFYINILSFFSDNDIVFETHSDDEEETMTLEDIDDLSDAFIKYCNYFFESGYILKIIELESKNKNEFNDDQEFFV